MSLKYKHLLLFVDDEVSITRSLKRLFRKETYQVYTASSGREGLQILKETGKPFSLIISDQRMPEMTGTEFLEKAKEVFPQAIRILLTGYTDMEAIVDAINRGGIHRYFTKPWNDEDLLLQIRQCLEQYELVAENRRLLNLTKKQNAELKELNSGLEEKVAERTKEVTEKNASLVSLNKELESNLFNTVRAFASFVEMITPTQAGHGRRVGTLSRRIAEHRGLDSEEVTQIEMAGLLHDFGKIGFSEKLLKYKEEEWTSKDRALFREHPQRGRSALQFIDKLNHAGILIGCHHEQYDGKGYPDGLTEEEIPIGSRIIAVANAYDKIVAMGVLNTQRHKGSPGGNGGAKLTNEALVKKAIEHFKVEAFAAYDPDIIKCFLSLLKAEGVEFGGEREVDLHQLEPGMTLTAPLHTKSGKFLLPENTVLTVDHVKKLMQINELEPVEEAIGVQLGKR